jgi:glucose/arabinose dehydrogenase
MISALSNRPTHLRSLQWAIVAASGGLLYGCGGSDDEPNPPPTFDPPVMVSGLDARPSNTTCLAWARSTGAISLTTPRVFPNLSFTSPVGLFQAPGDSARWFVLEQAGRVRTFANQSTVSVATDFIDIRSRVVSGGELGLLGMAFHPDFATNRRVYLHYTTGSAPRTSRVSQFTASMDLSILDPNSEQVLMTVAQPEDNHNGGALAFGLDGYLYIALGDGGGGGDNHGSIGNGQTMTTLLGKILRIDVNAGTPYGIPSGPSGNPHAGNTLCGATKLSGDICLRHAQPVAHEL